MLLLMAMLMLLLCRCADILQRYQLVVLLIFSNNEMNSVQFTPRQMRIATCNAEGKSCNSSNENCANACILYATRQIVKSIQSGPWQSLQPLDTQID